MTWCYEHLHPILCFASFQNLRKVYIVNVFHWCVWTQSDRLLIVTIFPLKLNSNPSPDFSVKRVLSGIKLVTRDWILTTFWKTDELNWNKQFLKFLRKKAFLKDLIVSQNSFVENLFWRFHWLKCVMKRISTKFGQI